MSLSSSKRKGRLGVNYVERRVLEAGGSFIQYSEDLDIGIDGFIEFPDGHGTSKLVAVQIKCGDSCFDRSGPRHSAEPRHIRLWRTYAVPVRMPRQLTSSRYAGDSGDARALGADGNTRIVQARRVTHSTAQRWLRPLESRLRLAPGSLELRSVLATISSIAGSDTLPEPADFETEFAPGRAHVRRVARLNLWILYRFDATHVDILAVRREPPEPADPMDPE